MTNARPTNSTQVLTAKSRTLDVICIVSVLLVTTFSWIPRRHGPIDFRWDAATYYILGTSLAEGKGPFQA